MSVLAHVDELGPRYTISCLVQFKKAMFFSIPENNTWVVKDVKAGVQSLGRHENVAYEI